MMAGQPHRFPAAGRKPIWPEYAPEAVAALRAFRRDASVGWRPKSPASPSTRRSSSPQPWTDFRGERHDHAGPPGVFHAMRGISAHSNGFQTARALHLLQILLGIGRLPGGFRLKPPYPKPVEAHPTPHFGRISARQALVRAASGLCRAGPTICCSMPRRQPGADRQGVSWENPFSAHGLMHMVIPNAHAGDPYRIDTLFLYMANMAWNSSMNTARVMEMLTDKDATANTRFRIIYSDAYASPRWWPMPI
jgi:anaerobic selenocysteine-containing dehydrogenase